MAAASEPGVSLRIEKRRSTAAWVVAAVVASVILGIALFFAFHRKPVSLRGAVTMQDADPKKELPIADVEITAANDLKTVTAKSDAMGFFRITLPVALRRGHAVTLQFRRPGYRPLDLKEFASDKLYVARMVPLPRETRVDANQPQFLVGNVRIRYSIKTMAAVNIGSAVQVFQIENKGNVPCNGHDPCSLDGKWKAAIGGASLDAGTGNEFRDARVSCIAGPCPFTKIESDQFSKGGEAISVSARGWSDTTTFLLEAEVFHPMASELVHHSYPVIFGRALNFTLPSESEGVSIEADIERSTIIFPLGPALHLSWADCNARVNPDRTKVYRCELKPGYRF
ncbi:MAG: hypothetical protein DMG88_14765 [Acidobacteria bacterium]|nr:MAG: hypothetical protein DMG88_14765 [Acidobacteriota bacterium]